MGFISSLFGGSQNSTSSQSGNANNGLITSDFGQQAQNGGTADNYLTSLLTGTGNTGAANSGYQNYLSQAGYAPAMKQLSQNLTGQGAASGLLNSGSTTKALANYGGQLNNQFYNNYLQNLSGAAGLGTQAGGLITSAGQTSSSTGQGSNNQGALSGIGSVVGGIASIFSDRRLKTEIKLLKREGDGLGWYSFEYKNQPGAKKYGVMADEVEEFRPWALGPTVGGFATVNYGAL